MCAGVCTAADVTVSALALEVAVAGDTPSLQGKSTWTGLRDVEA